MIYAPIEKSEDWRRFLADPDKQWREGYSAHALAHSWQDAAGFPREIKLLFESSSELHKIEPLLVLPEHKVSLPGGSRPSQNDVWVLAKVEQELVSITIEGKVAETFGPTVSEWSTAASLGKTERLAYLCKKIGLSEPCPGDVRYQLLHRTASALIEAERFLAANAVMLIHSFGTTQEGFADYRYFAKLLGVNAEPGKLSYVGHLNGIQLYIGWASGDPVAKSVL